MQEIASQREHYKYNEGKQQTWNAFVLRDKHETDTAQRCF